MQTSKDKLKNFFLGVFVLIMFFAPVSVFLDTHNEASVALTFEQNTVYASGWDLITHPGSFIGYSIMSIGAAFTWVGGSILDLAIQEVVVGFGRYIRDGGPDATKGLGGTVTIVWQLVRDICNLFFIFGFIYVGIKTIYDYESSSTKKMLATLIMSALLINFSLFITKFIIEFSNVLAYSVYTALTKGGGTISSEIMNILGLTSFWNTLGGSNLTTITDSGNLWFFVMAFIFLIIAAFIFLSGALMLVSRFVGLLFIMMFSPLLFAAQVFPQTAKYSKDIWSKLLSYSFYAPAYLFLILVAILILKSLPLGGNFADLAKGADSISDATSSVGMFGIILNFVIAITVLQTAATLAQKFGLAGSAIAIKIADKGKRVAAAATVGMAARAGRGSLGWGAHRISETELIKDNASRSGWRGALARGTLKGTRSVADSSFDARNVGGLGKKTGIGEGRKGGYTSVRKEVEQREEKFAQSLGELDDDNPRVIASKEALDGAKAKVKAAQREVEANAGGTEAQKGVALANLETAKEQAKEAEKEYGKRKLARQTQYGQALEGSRWYNSWPLGESAAHRRAAGKAIRKARKEGKTPKIKKGKEKKDDDKV